eukprot:298845-Prorocentrum_minimum.AAC.4
MACVLIWTHAQHVSVAEVQLASGQRSAMAVKRIDTCLRHLLSILEAHLVSIATTLAQQTSQGYIVHDGVAARYPQPSGRDSSSIPDADQSGEREEVSEEQVARFLLRWVLGLLRYTTRNMLKPLKLGGLRGYILCSLAHVFIEGSPIEGSGMLLCRPLW